MSTLAIKRWVKRCSTTHKRQSVPTFPTTDPASGSPTFGSCSFGSCSVSSGLWSVQLVMRCGGLVENHSHSRAQMCGKRHVTDIALDNVQCVAESGCGRDVQFSCRFSLSYFLCFAALLEFGLAARGDNTSNFVSPFTCSASVFLFYHSEKTFSPQFSERPCRRCSGILCGQIQCSMSMTFANVPERSPCPTQ